MMTGIEKFKQKYAKNTSLLGGTPDGEDGPKHQESNQSLTARKKSPGEVKLDKFGQTVAGNFAG
jgi:hypothetical protein